MSSHQPAGAASCIVYWHAWKRFRSACSWLSRLMTPADLLNSLVAVYPPEGTQLERAGALNGDRRNVLAPLQGLIKAMACPFPYSRVQTISGA